MKLQFDPKQQYQLDAVAAVVDLFDGQPLEQPEYAVIHQEEYVGLFSGQLRTELGVGNCLSLTPEALRDNTRAVQERNEIDVSDPAAPLESWAMPDPEGGVRSCPHFSVEMETGTGKTYVYLRTIFELSRRYGFKKFIIVVPSVAIREGVLKNIEITRDHFRALYNNVEFEYFVYDARKVNKLRQFAVSNTIQILVINIDAFRKNFTGTEDEQKSNVIYKENDRLSGRQPIEFVQAANPIVIIDEPQSVDSTEKSQEAIRALNPLCTLRYSATHKNPYNLVYRLDPIRAFELRLVKQIVVASVTASGAMNDPFVRVDKIDNTKGISANLRLHVQTPSGPKEKGIKVKAGTDLYEISDNRANYRDGFVVAEINAEPGNEYVRFDNGRVLHLGETLGGLHEDVWRMQIKNTIKKHLDRELQVQVSGLKVLSLFFIDRVANYRSYDEGGQPVRGKFAAAFESALAELAADERYRELTWLKEPVERLHNGYFAQDKKGVLKDTRGDTQADDDVYNLIMKDKERLLSMDEPLRFIFSHSALREGWDNPNVFQICTLNETHSVTKKRQEIGRGLRLPVNQDGERVFDDSINKLLVVANESYEDFASTLQTEYEEDCGVTFGKVPSSAISRLSRIVGEQQQAVGKEAAAEIWQSLVSSGFIAPDGKIQPAFDPQKPGLTLALPAAHQDVEKAVIDLLSSYQLERHVRRERDEGPNRLRKEVQLSPEFQELWERIKPRTTYRVEFETDDLVRRAVDALKKMEKIEPAQLHVSSGALYIQQAGVKTEAVSAIRETVQYQGPLPDLLAYLQGETELTRSTLVRILKESGRLPDFFVNPQRFMDAVAAVLKHELHRLLVDGIKYERISGTEPEAEWDMVLFRDEELINYLTALPVKKSVYEYVAYDSNVEREFAEKLNERDDIKLFVKLPGWFKVDTPVGEYNPDWAIVKHNDQTVYLVRETKDTKDFLKLRNSESDKVRCGQRHFEAIGVPFAVAVTADEV
ncbi:MAG: DEAD/DEAH box helicase family protein [Dehalococcoidia bacterium]|nr:DEAD/DEAH box helicase family protein [Dehalococcoidia bacterium]